MGIRYVLIVVVHYYVWLAWWNFWVHYCAYSFPLIQSQRPYRLSRFRSRIWGNWAKIHFRLFENMSIFRKHKRTTSFFLSFVLHNESNCLQLPSQQYFLFQQYILSCPVHYFKTDSFALKSVSSSKVSNQKGRQIFQDRIHLILHHEIANFYSFTSYVVRQLWKGCWFFFVFFPKVYGYFLEKCIQLIKTK